MIENKKKNNDLSKKNNVDWESLLTAILGLMSFSIGIFMTLGTEIACIFLGFTMMAYGIGNAIIERYYSFRLNLAAIRKRL